MVVRFAAALYALLTLGTVAFQLALALGAPWGSYAWGGVYSGALPLRMRLASVVAILILALLLAVVLSRAGLFVNRWSGTASKLIWFVAAYLLFAIMGNAMSSSSLERNLWLPISIVLFCCTLVVARGRGRYS